MIRHAPKILIALAVATALALAGCGGDDDDSTTTAGGSGDTTQPRDLSPRAQRALEEARGRARQRDGGEGRGDSGGGPPATVPFREPTGTAPTSSGSLPNEGGKAPAPGVPLAKGGDNSIQTFGVEGPSADRVEASKVFQAYLNARLAGDWARACSYLTGQMKQEMERLGGQASRGESSDCAQVMRGLTEGLSKEALRSAADIRVLSMRIEDAQAFLIYRDGEGLPSVVPMNLDGGAWKVAAIGGSALFLGV